MLEAERFGRAANQFAKPRFRDQPWPVYDYYFVCESEDGEEYIHAPQWVPAWEAARIDWARARRAEPPKEGDPTLEGIVSNVDPSAEFYGVSQRSELKKHLRRGAQHLVDEFVEYGEEPRTKKERRAAIAGRLNEELDKAVAEIMRCRKDMRKPYRPLADDGLVLRFVEEFERTGFDTAAVMGWVEERGVLGLSGYAYPGGWHPNTRGAAEESVRKFREVAEEAQRTLALLEAATSSPANVEKMQELLESRSKSRHQLKEAAFGEVKATVRRWTALHGSTAFYDLPGMSGLAQGYGFRSVPCAMYMQLGWLLAEHPKLRRCKFEDCNNMFFVNTEPKNLPEGQYPGQRGKGTYRGRTDREFCGQGNCRQNQHYREKQSLGR